MSAAVLEVISENARFGPQRSWDSLFLKISIGFVWLLDQMTHKKWLVWLTIWLVGKVILRNLDFLFFFFFFLFSLVFPIQACWGAARAWKIVDKYPCHEGLPIINTFVLTVSF